MRQDMKNYIIGLAEKNERNTGDRDLNSFRDVSIKTGVSETAEGSALVNIGDTQVIAGVKLDVGTPYPDSPDQGNLICTVELAPIGDAEFEPGPPRGPAIEVARVVDRGIRESGSVDLKKLCIEEGEKVWNVFIDFYVLNNDGNLIDACGLAAVSALKTAKIPELNEDNEVQYGELTEESVPVVKLPIPVTIAKIGEYLMVDPDKEEESWIDARLTVTCSDGEINSLQKGETGGFKLSEIEECLTKSFKIRDKIVKLVKALK